MPRRDFKRPPEVLERHPTGLSVVLLNTIIFGLGLADVDMTQETVAALNVVIGGWVSILFPRFR